MIPAFFLLAAVVLRDDTNTIPPQRWRYERFVTKDQLPVDVDCAFKVERGPNVRVELMTEDNLEALREGRPHEAIVAATDGNLHQEIGVPGTFAIVILNDDKSLVSEVRLRLSLDFSQKSLPVTGELSPQRKLTVYVLSLAGFLLLVTVSARQLIVAMRNSKITSSHTPDEGGLIPPTPVHDPD